MKIRHSLVSNARKLRNDGTDVERLLWRQLKSSQVEGIKFRRQQPIEDYIVFDVLRFWNNEILENIEGVLEVIRQRCLELASPTPQPPPARGGGE